MARPLAEKSKPPLAQKGAVEAPRLFNIYYDQATRAVLRLLPKDAGIKLTCKAGAGLTCHADVDTAYALLLLLYADY